MKDGVIKDYLEIHQVVESCLDRWILLASPSKWQWTHTITLPFRHKPTIWSVLFVTHSLLTTDRWLVKRKGPIRLRNNAHLWNVLLKLTTVLPKSAMKENEDNVAEPTEDEEMELSVMTDLSVMEETAECTNRRCCGWTISIWPKSKKPPAMLAEFDHDTKVL